MGGEIASIHVADLEQVAELNGVSSITTWAEKVIIGMLFFEICLVSV